MARKGMIRPSTRAFWREARRREGFSFFDLAHGYLYGRWPHLYIALGTGRHPLAKRAAPVISWLGRFLTRIKPSQASATSVRFEDTYHGKVVPLSAARQLVSVKENIALGDLERVIPYQLARELILEHPDHIAVMDCPCRASMEHPCLPLDVCLVIGEPFASFVVEHQPKKARWITYEEAQAILQAEDRRGHVHHAFFKDAMLGRFYAICNCCTCCCAALQSQRRGTPMLASSGYLAVVDPDRCNGCGRCQRACLFSALSMNGKAAVDTAACMGCGVCVGQCRQQALRLERAPEKGEPLELERLMEAASQKPG